MKTQWFRCLVRFSDSAKLVTVCSIDVFARNSISQIETYRETDAGHGHNLFLDTIVILEIEKLWPNNLDEVSVFPPILMDEDQVETGIVP